MAHRQPLQVSTPNVPGYAEQLLSIESSNMQGSESPGLPTSPRAFLPRSARANLTHSMRSGSGSPRGSNMFLPGAHRADSIEAMLAAIPSRFSIEKSLSLNSSSSSRATSRLMAGARPVPDPEIVALTNALGAHGGHVTEAMGTDDMPRTFSGKSGLLDEPSEAAVPVPELFEAYHVRPRGRGTGHLPVSPCSSWYIAMPGILHSDPWDGCYPQGAQP
ncbi:hypothetical protein WJX79_008184 [Trebouxia sp. C0005]